MPRFKMTNSQGEQTYFQCEGREPDEIKRMFELIWTNEGVKVEQIQESEE